jgi:hypothetical protein
MRSAPFVTCDRIIISFVTAPFALRYRAFRVFRSILQVRPLLESDIVHDVSDSNSPSQARNLPSLDQATVVLEYFPGERLGEVVSTLSSGVNLQDVDVLRLCAYIGPEVVPLYMEVLGPVGESLVGCQVDGSLIVFHYSGRDGSTQGVKSVELDDFDNQQTEGNNLLQ